MEKKGDYQRRNKPVNNFRPNNNQGGQAGQQSQSNPNPQSSAPQNNSSGRGPRGPQEQGVRRDNPHFKNYNRDNRDNREYRDGGQRSGYQSQGGGIRYPHKPRAEETIDDIKSDIVRIEKEIQLEIKEIRSMKLGL